MAIAITDICGSELALRLWHGVSNSPIITIMAGHGIGACLAAVVVRPFIKFNPQKLHQNNNSYTEFNLTSSPPSIKRELTPSDIQLKIPFSIAALYSSFLAICFIVSQFIETKNRKKHKLLNQKFKNEPLIEAKNALINDQSNQEKFKKWANNLIFKVEYDSNKLFAVKIIQLVILVILGFSSSGFISIETNFMITYLTKGPAKLSIGNYFTFQIIFWLLYVFGRFMATLIAYKINTLAYFIVLCLFNLIVLFIYIVPALNTNKLFLWIIVFSLSFISGPIIPSVIMIAKHTLVHVSSTLISIFGVSMAMGGIAAYYITGHLLDNLKLNSKWLGYQDATSVYVIPYIMLLFAVLVILCSFLLLVVQFKFKKLLNEHYRDNK